MGKAQHGFGERKEDSRVGNTWWIELARENEPDLGEQGITKGAETLKNGEPLRILGKHQEEPLNFKVSFQEKCLSFQACRLSQQK